MTAKPHTAAPAFLDAVADRVRQKEVFADVRTTSEGLRCDALGIESEAWYLAQPDARQSDRVWIGLYTPDRWLSQSIEADLMHLGDDIRSLLEEELVDVGYDGPKLDVEHFRDDAKRYVFRSPVPLDEPPTTSASVQRLAAVLLAYEACFRQLGDMQGGGDE